MLFNLKQFEFLVKLRGGMAVGTTAPIFGIFLKIMAQSEYFLISTLNSFGILLCVCVCVCVCVQCVCVCVCVCAI